MSSYKKHITRFSTFLLSLALLLPVAVQFAHAFEAHEHEICYEVDTHLHEQKVDCQLCDFHFSVADINLEAPLQFVTYKRIYTADKFQPLTVYKNILPTRFLRGPPITT